MLSIQNFISPHYKLENIKYCYHHFIDGKLKFTESKSYSQKVADLDYLTLKSFPYYSAPQLGKLPLQVFAILLFDSQTRFVFTSGLAFKIHRTNNGSPFIVFQRLRCYSTLPYFFITNSHYFKHILG